MDVKKEMREACEMKIHCAHDEIVSVSQLKPFPKNPNVHSKEQIERLAEILRYQGWRYPIKISNRSGFITSGHGRLSAAILNGWSEVPVNYQDYESDEQQYADVVSDNAIAAWAGLDLAAINFEVPELGPDFSIDLLGIQDFVIEPADKYGEKDADVVPEIRKTDITLGMVFALGRHRLMCADATDRDSVLRLMNGEKADLLLTDPPYGVSYMKKNAAVNGGMVKIQENKEIENDENTIEEMGELWKTLFAYDECFKDQASYYVFSPQGGDLMMMMMMINQSRWQLKHTLIWNKQNFVFGRCDYHYKHEPILYGWKRKGSHNWYGDRSQSSVLDFDKQSINKDHPTQKPVELLKYLIKNSTQSVDLVVDLFNGSGSCLLAAETTSRRYHGIEINPGYIQCTIDRWENLTGQKAEKIS